MRTTDTSSEREQLEKERDVVLEDIRHMQEWLQGEVDVDAEEGDPDLAERDKTQALLIAMERKLESINAALRAIEKGLYGICERCGNQIDPARLEVRPDATLCLDCQREVERLARRSALRQQDY
ncbi:MAG: TraR/DksA family transcriptional regulator [Anaerolineae bacterium]|jgi:RNA polymerase-binding protein DksA